MWNTPVLDEWIGLITGAIVFIAVYIAAIASIGWVVGIALGWVAAGAAGYITYNVCRRWWTWVIISIIALFIMLGHKTS
jgi:glycerol-3-phosphate acyltransferase PlsY